MLGLRIGTATVAVILSFFPGQGFPVESHSRFSEAGHYRVTLRSVPDVPPIARLHDWIVHVETRDGEIFRPRQLGISGSMPAHGHGLASAPRVTEYLDNGDFLIEGMKFQMGGDWRLIVALSGPKGFDRAVFELSLSAAPADVDRRPMNWTPGEIAFLKQFTLDAMPATADPSNRFSGNQQAAELGRLLFFDKDLSASGTVSCATCHDPAMKFADGKKKSFGTRETARHAPGLIGVSHGEWFYWDGRRDSLWAQTITPIETPGEMDNTRVRAVAHVMKRYGAQYEALTGNRVAMGERRFPAAAGPFAEDGGEQAWRQMLAADRETINRAFSNIGKFLAAYIETLEPRRSRFDRFVAALDGERRDEAAKLLNGEEQAGLKLFLDGARTQCLRCHNGPMFTNFGFHNIATSVAADGSRDYGRMFGLKAAMLDEFNCRGPYSDQPAEDCAELEFADSGHAVVGAFKVPSLRNVAMTAPYMHDGRFATLEEVMEFYTQVPDASVGPHELPALELSDEETAQLVAFLRTLSGGSGE